MIQSDVDAIVQVAHIGYSEELTADTVTPTKIRELDTVQLIATLHLSSTRTKHIIRLLYWCLKRLVGT